MAEVKVGQVYRDLYFRRHLLVETVYDTRTDCVACAPNGKAYADGTFGVNISIAQLQERFELVKDVKNAEETEG